MNTNDLPLTDLAVCAALERLAEENARSAQLSRASGEKDDARFFQRAANAYVKALTFYRAGLRPDVLPSGSFMLPSQRPGEPPHLLTRDGDWRCTCPAGDAMHWASALIIGIEVASDDMERFDDLSVEPEATGATPATLGQRLADARKRYSEAA